MTNAWTIKDLHRAGYNPSTDSNTGADYAPMAKVGATKPQQEDRSSLVRGVQRPQDPTHRAEQEHSDEQGRNNPWLGHATRPTVRITAYTCYEMDGDNMISGCKHLRDCVSSLLGLDDADKHVRWSYHHVRVHRKRDEGTCVIIDGSL